ncbi:hypothetical protein [Jannaschia sp. R86511]|uniref:hypothetical protein n=1 Tax=Jannaschia sp. R86511 TaxID=3093853 RepID=UPI0036D3DE68
MSEQPDNGSTGGSDPTAPGHHEVPLEVLEQDETVPPRPEESASDAVTERRSEPGEGR